MLTRIWRRIRAATEQLVLTTPRILPGATEMQYYEVQLMYQGALPNETITFKIADGYSLPAGLTLTTGGLLSGTIPQSTFSETTTVQFAIVAQNVR